MKSTLAFAIWMIVSGGLIISLSCWAIFYIEKTEHQIAVFAIIGAIVTAITSVLAVTLNNKKTKERELELMVVKEKHKVFDHFYNAFFELLKNTKKSNKGGLSKKAQSEMMEFKRGLMNWGSEELIRNYLEYDEALSMTRDGDSEFELLKDGEKFLRDLRREMGFDDSGKVNIMSIILTTEAREDMGVSLER